MSAALHYERAADVTHVRVSGVIDERFDGRKAAARVKSKHAILNCAGVVLITSFGIRRWLDLVQTLERNRVQAYFVDCSPKFVEELNQVVRFSAHGRVLSFYSPYSCPDCRATRSILFRVDKDAEVIRSRQPPSYSCLACGAPMEFDDDPASYFADLQRHVGDPIDESILHFLEARLGYRAEADRQLHIQKLVIDDVTVICFGGTLDGTLKAKLAEGLEGRVALDFSDIIHVEQPGLRAWRDFVNEAKHRASQLILVECPALVIERALEGTAGDGNVEVVSTRIAYHCSRCDATHFESLPLAGREGALVRQGQIPKHTCGGCRGETAAMVGTRLLDQLMTLPEPTSSKGSLQRILRRARKEIQAARAVRRPKPNRNLVPWIAASAATAALAISVVASAAYLLRSSDIGIPVVTPTPASSPASDTPKFERPDWILSDTPGSSYCTERAGVTACVGVSPFAANREEAERLAFDSALEAVLHSSLLGADNANAKSQRDRYLNARTRALQAIEDARLIDDPGAEPAALQAAQDARSRVATLVREWPTPGAPTQRSAWYWEEYRRPGSSGPEFLAFARVDLAEKERDALLGHYTTPIQVGGASFLPLFPGVGWIEDFSGKTALVAVRVGSGELRRAGLEPTDVLVLDGAIAGPNLPEAVLAAARGSSSPDVVIRRGPNLGLVSRLGKR